MSIMQKKGDPYGAHRVIEPANCLPQAATRLDNDFSALYDNEILCDVTTLNIDAASFTVIRERAQDDPQRIAAIMLDIVARYGKHQNPWTGSGGMFIGRVARIGEALQGRIDLQVGDIIASLVSLTLTPLRIDRIKQIHLARDQADIDGQALLFESGVWAKLPDDLPRTLALALLDVSGAAAQVDRLVAPGDTVAVLGGAGKSGLLCCYQAKKKAGPEGRVIAVIPNESELEVAQQAPFIDRVLVSPADRPLELLRAMREATAGRLCDVVVSCVSRENCEMGAILCTRPRGKVYFFSMATSFTKAALGAEGVGRDIDMLIGNGYCAGHAELTLNIVRESAYLNALYRQRYG